MIYEQILTLLEVLSLVVHNLIFLLILICISRLFFVKYTPYSIFYIASILLVQAIYNGCPISDINNFFSYRIGIEIDQNQFFGGIFGQYSLYIRILTLLSSTLLFYVSYKTWDKPKTKVDFSRIFHKKSELKMYI